MTFSSAIDETQATADALAVRETFRQIYERTERSLHRVAWAVLLDRAEAADVVQEAYLQLHRELERLPPDVRIEAWLCRVTVNLACSWRRRLVRFGRRWVAPSHRGDPEQQVGEREGLEVLKQALLALPARQRAVAALHLDRGLTPAEIAETLEITANLARVSLHRALTQLRTALSDAGIDPESLSAPSPTISPEHDE